MRVLHLASGTDYGGAKTHLFTLLPELAKHVEVGLGCFSAGLFLEEAHSLGIRVHSLRQVTRYDLGAIARLEALVRRHDYDLIHCHGPRPNVLGALARRRLARPLVTTVHSDYRQDFAGQPLRHLVFTKANAWALRRFDRYLVGLGVEESILRLGIPRALITSLKNGLPFERPPAPAREEILASLGLDLPPEIVLVGIIARLHPVKGHEVFLAGAAKVARVQPRVHFLIAGDGPVRSALERLAGRLGVAGRVSFLGHVAPPHHLFAVLDVNTLTSTSETQPYALLEGARWGVATLSSRVGGIPELIVDGRTGYLFEPGDVDGFAARLAELVEDPALRRRLGRALYDHGRRAFTPDVMARTCLGVYEELVSGRESPDASD